MDRANSIATIAVTTAGVLLALASIHGSVSCSISDILEGHASGRSKESRLVSDQDDDDDDSLAAFLAIRVQMEEGAAAAAALYGEGLLTNMELFGMNVGRWYVKPRSLTWFDNFVQNVYDNERWKKLFRVGRATFMYLITSLHAKLEQTPPRSLARAIPTRHLTVVKQLAVTLYKLGHGVSNFGIGELFDLGESTVSDVVWRVSQALVEIEAPQRIRWPEAGEERRKAIAQMQAVHGIPNCIGAIDCTHINHDASVGYLTTDFYDRDHNFSTVVQLVGNQEHRILNVNVGYPGVVHDTRVLYNSKLYKHKEAFFGGPSINVNGIEVPQLLVADAGYPMEPWLLTPYPGHHLNPTHESFNFKHSSTRMFIEQINGELKGVQRFLLAKIQKPKLERIPVYVAACCTLHNLRIDMGDVMERALQVPAPNEGQENLGEIVMEATGVSNVERASDIRNAIPEVLGAGT